MKHRAAFYGGGQIPTLKKYRKDGLDIKYTGEPFKTEPIRLPREQRLWAWDKLQEEERQGLIQRVSDPHEMTHISPIFLKKEPEPKRYRICVDYRKLNKGLRMPMGPLKSVDEVISLVTGYKYYCTLDVASGYNQIPLSKSATRYLSFCCLDPEGNVVIYGPTRLNFGTMVAPSLYHGNHEEILYLPAGEFEAGCIGVVVYLDDVTIFANTLGELATRLDAYLTKAEEAGLIFKPSKVKIAREEVKIVGRIVSRHGVRPCPESLDVLRDYPQPRTPKQLRAFLGLRQWVDPFLPHSVTPSLRRLQQLVNEKRIHWTEELIEDFHVVRDAATKAVSLRAFDPSKPAILDVDSSAIGVGGLLLQEQTDTNTWQVVALGNKAFPPAARDYAPGKREALGIVTMLRKWEKWLLYCPKVIVRTDCSGAIGMLKPGRQVYHNELDAQIRRFATYASRFCLELEYVKGKTHVAADTLGRLEYLEESFTDAAKLIRRALRVDSTTYTADKLFELSDELFGSVYLRRLIEQQAQDPYCAKLLDTIAIKRKPVQHDRDSYFFVDEEYPGVLRRRADTETGPVKQFVVPKSMVNDVLTVHHDKLGAHGGRQATLHRLLRSYWWETVHQDVKEFVKNCRACQLAKTRFITKQGLFRVRLPQATFLRR